MPTRSTCRAHTCQKRGIALSHDGEDDRRYPTLSLSPTSAWPLPIWPTYGYRRVHALLRRKAEENGCAGLIPRTIPVESPQSNGMAEAFVRKLKRDYARVSPRPIARAVIKQLSGWLDHYNRAHPHRALGYRSPRSSSLAQPARACQAFWGATTGSRHENCGRIANRSHASIYCKG